MNKPIIGIVAKPVEKHEMDFWRRMDVIDEFRCLVVKNGGIAISLLSPEETFNFNNNDIADPKQLSTEEINDIDRMVKLCDGVILQGGLVSCNYEIEIAKKCIEYDIPIIGICAGFNNIIRAAGSDVFEDRTNSHNFYKMDYRHNINIVKDTLVHNLSNANTMQVNSIHSMLATKENVEFFAKISSFSDDGYVESFEMPNKKFIVGIKWHPELMLEEDFTNKLFEKFIQVCK